MTYWIKEPQNAEHYLMRLERHSRHDGRSAYKMAKTVQGIDSLKYVGPVRQAAATYHTHLHTKFCFG